MPFNRLILAITLAAPGASAQQGHLQIAHLGTCTVTSGQQIKDCRIGYRTFGTLDAARDNAVIMPSWLNGRSEDLIPLISAVPNEKTLIDTTKFFAIAFDSFGDGVSSSPSNSPQQAGPAFPRFTLEDSARAQYRVLTETLHLSHIHAAIGLSMGAHQVFALAVLYPKFMDFAVSIVGSPQPTPFDLLSKQLAIDAIHSDPAFLDGHYTTEPPLKLANALGTMMVSAPAWRNEHTSREKFPTWLTEVESPQRQDANDRISQLQAILDHDVLHGRPLADVARETEAAGHMKFLIIAAAEDRMVAPGPALEWAHATSAETYLSLGACAHLIMDCDATAVSSRVQGFLSH